MKEDCVFLYNDFLNFLFLAEVTVLVLPDSMPIFFKFPDLKDLLRCSFDSDKIADSWQGP